MQKVLIRPIHIESLPSFFHIRQVDATAAITLAAGGEWNSETLDVLFVLPNRSAGDALVWYSKLFSYLYRFATVWLDRMRWQPQLGRMGMKVEGAGKRQAIRYWLTLVSGLGTTYT
ncbi:pregnancy-specific beta-1-glycoprotein 4 [Striga asiatica]|uniref:Pregnancy-specific beta-1-glycoprotein 4 n=1 Tax=Striga asiatica TaxID=4170 RepID=A0A5A7QKI9_STRAF|nr:pregnancy-specific beta-1-glycoprotein 4 [Striga asiatica]